MFRMAKHLYGAEKTACCDEVERWEQHSVALALTVPEPEIAVIKS
jgi:hypothetical protein